MIGGTPPRRSSGHPPKMRQEFMGHASTTATTLDLYGHLYPGDMDRYADRLNEAAGMSAADDAAKKMRPDDEGGAARRVTSAPSWET